MIIRWSKLSFTERGMFMVVLVLASSAAFFMASIAFHHGYHRTQERGRVAYRLQVELQADSRFESIFVSYEDPCDRKDVWLLIRGTVASQEDLDALHQMIDNEGKWHMEWGVDVAAK